jgi:hypothetical protein
VDELEKELGRFYFGLPLSGVFVLIYKCFHCAFKIEL